MHHMCVDMSTYCGDDWYNDMCGDVRMSIWISTYCEDVYMDIVWVGGGMVIACHVMPSHRGAHGIQPAGSGTHLIAIEGLTLLFRKS